MSFAKTFSTLFTGCVRKIPHYSLRHPWTALLIATTMTLAAAPGILHLKLRTDGNALIPANAPEVRFDKAIRDQFGIEDETIVLIRSTQTNGIFNAHTIQVVKDLTADFRKLPGINPSNIISLATEPSFRLRPGTFIPQKLLEPPLKMQADLELLREDLQQIELYTGTLVSLDGSSTAILIGTPADCDRTRLYFQIRKMIAGRQPVPEEITVTGAPVAESLLGIHILEDLGVPRKLFGAGAQTTTDRATPKTPANLRQLMLFLVRKVGLVPVTMAVMVLVLLVSFRNPLATVIPLPGIIATLVSVFGLMGWAGVPIYLTSVVMPILLVATGVTNDIYLFTRYFILLRENVEKDPIELLDETFEKLASAVAITSLATGIGFLSFAFSPLVPVSAFGVWAGIGVLLGLFYSLFVVPAILSLIPSNWLLLRWGFGQRTTFSRLAAFFENVGQFAERRRRLVFACILIVLLLTPIGLRRLIVQDSWADEFDPDSEFSCATRLVNTNFYGMHLLFVCVDASETASGELAARPNSLDRILLPGNICDDLQEIEGSAITLSATPVNTKAPHVWHSRVRLLRREGTNIVAWVVPTTDGNSFANDAGDPKFHYELAVRSQLKPDIVNANRDLAGFLRQQRGCAVGGVIGPFEYLTTTRFMTQPSSPAARELTPLAGRNRALWDYYKFALGQSRFHQIMDDAYSRSLTTVFLRDANYVDTSRLMANVRAYERERLAPIGIKLGFAGDVAVSQSLIHGVVTTQLQSLCWSLAGIFAVTVALGGSWRWGVYCVLPSLMAILVKFAAMGLLGIPLGVATSMFAAMTLGIGVNCAIQLLEGFNQARSAGVPVTNALNQSLRLTGPPALINTIAVSLGFGVLMLSQVPANGRLGLLLVLGLVNCFILSLLLLPALIHWWPPKCSSVSKKQCVNRGLINKDG